MWRPELPAEGLIDRPPGSDDGTPSHSRPAVAARQRDESAIDAGVSWPIMWAHIPFSDDLNQGKTRPVLVLESGIEFMLALPMYSRKGRTTDSQAWVQLSDQSAATYDKKCAPSWIKVSRPNALPYHALTYPGRQPGVLTPQDLQRLKAALSEYGLHTPTSLMARTSVDRISAEVSRKDERTIIELAGTVVDTSQAPLARGLADRHVRQVDAEVAQLEPPHTNRPDLFGFPRAIGVQ